MHHSSGLSLTLPATRPVRGFVAFEALPRSHPLRVLATAAAMVGLRIDRSPRQTLCTLAAIAATAALALAFTGTDLSILLGATHPRPPVGPALAYFVGTWVTYYVGHALVYRFGLNHALRRRLGDEAAYDVYSTALGVVYFHVVWSQGPLLSATRGSLDLDGTAGEVLLLSLGLFAVTFTLKVWATLHLGVDGYFYRDMFLDARRDGGAAVEGPYAFFSDPIYSVGYCPAEAGIAVEQRGLLVVAQRPEAMAVLDAFRATDMGAGCELLGAEEARRRCGDSFARRPIQGALWSPHELRVDSRRAVPRLAAWLETEHGVRFWRRVGVRDVSSGRVETSAGTLQAGRVVVCPGDDLVTLFPERIAALGIERCSLQMLKVAPEAPNLLLPAVVMSDLSLVRYQGFAALPEAAGLRARLQAEQPAHLEHGIHLIVAQDADGALIVGDSHHYGWSPSPFARAAVDDLILGELRAVLNLPDARVVERWVGVHASLPGVLMVREAPAPGVRLVIVTSGTGASTAFAIAEETLEEFEAP